MSDLSVGWVGMGRMGEAMCERLVATGLPVRVWNRTPEKTQAVVDQGATRVDHVSDLASCDVVFSMLAHGRAVDAVMNGDHGLLTGESGPGALIECSTISVEESATLRAQATAKGTDLLAAPVSGNPSVVSAGRMMFAVSGTEQAFDRVHEILDHVGSATYVGEGEVARNVKIAHNLYLAVVTQALAEVTILCERLGVRRADFLDFLNRSVLGSIFSGYKTPAFVNLDFHPTFTTRLLKKDLELGLAAARESEVTLPTVAITHQLVQGLIGIGHGDDDFATLIVQQAAMAGMDLVSEDADVTDGLGGL
jgi:3-hydroxyisobutyrate dehydrogenase-like beta-hydroxyacid dehydrogenase